MTTGTPTAKNLFCSVCKRKSLGASHLQRTCESLSCKTSSGRLFCNDRNEMETRALKVFYVCKRVFEVVSECPVDVRLELTRAKRRLWRNFSQVKKFLQKLLTFITFNRIHFFAKLHFAAVCWSRMAA